MIRRYLVPLFFCPLFLVNGCGDDTTSDAGGSDGSSDAITSDGTTSDGSTDVRDLPDGAPPDVPTLECDPELAAWQPHTFRFEGPAASETDSAPNPFTDYRLDVAFVSPSGASRTVPGYFDGDGDGGESGSVYIAHFTPDEAGEWSFSVSFTSGDNVAVDAEASGTPMGPDGEEGMFCVGYPDPTAQGFLGRGRLDYVDAHYLRFADGTYWIKGGADSPENLLGYAGFDNTEDLEGGAGTAGLVDGLHHFEPHVADWNDGDPDWNDGAGRGLIGALNYLGSEEVNSIYFLPCNLGGDGRDTHPYVNPADLTHMDLSKLRQWEVVFAHAERLGIALHFVLSETESGNRNLHDGGELGPQRVLFYRELIARFGHHNAVFWNIGEESNYGAARHTQFAAAIRELDPYDHPITVHTHLDRAADQYDMLVGDPGFELTSIQLSPENAGENTETWRRESAAAGRPWVVMLDEIGHYLVGVTDTNASEIRRITLWPGLMSGAGGVEWYFGYHDLPLGGDMRVEDFRTRAEMWQYTRIARHFFDENLPYWEMEPNDGLLNGEGEVFAKDGEIYAVYLPSGAAGAELDLRGATGTLSLRWFDPRAGEFVGAPTDVAPESPIALTPPSDASEDWVALLTGTVTVPEATCDYRAVDGIVVIEAESLDYPAPWTEGSDPAASGGAYIEWTGAPSTGSAGPGAFGTNIQISEPGIYRLQLRVSVGRGTSSSDHNDTWFRFPDADEFYGSQGAVASEDRVYPRPLCEDAGFIASVEALPTVTEASCPAGNSSNGYFKVYMSSGLNWGWSAFTSDSDGHSIVARFDSAGIYRLDIAARSDFHRLDRIVVHQVGLDDSVVRDPSLSETLCP